MVMPTGARQSTHQRVQLADEIPDFGPRVLETRTEPVQSGALNISGLHPDRRETLVRSSYCNSARLGQVIQLVRHKIIEIDVLGLGTPQKTLKSLSPTMLSRHRLYCRVTDYIAHEQTPHALDCRGDSVSQLPNFDARQSEKRLRGSASLRAECTLHDAPLILYFSPSGFASDCDFGEPSCAAFGDAWRPTTRDSY